MFKKEKHSMSASMCSTYTFMLVEEMDVVIKELNNKLMPDIRNAMFKYINNRSCKILKKERSL